MPNPTDRTDPAMGSPLAPVPRQVPWKSLAAVVIAALIGVGAAFDFDVCGLLSGVGVSLDACAPAAPAPSPTPAASSGPSPS